MSMCLLVGQPSDLELLALKCLFVSLVVHIRIADDVVWSVSPHGHVGISDILKRYKCAFMFLCPVTIVVKEWVVVVFIFSLSATIGK